MNKNWAYAGITLNNEDLGVSSIYYASSFLTTAAVNPLTTKAYTEEEIAAIKAGQEDGTDGYVAEVPAGAVIGVGVYGTDDILWFDAEGAAAIVSHSDPLTLNAATGEMVTAEGDVVATAME